VIDTNMLVSAVLTPGGTCAALLGHLDADGLVPIISTAMLWEYHAVFARPLFAERRETARALVSNFELLAEHIAAARVAPTLPDPHDQAFADAAVHANADLLITGNVADFAPLLALTRPRVLTPRQSLDLLDGRTTG
jgi:uncharacterized protein